ncbi:MAG: family 14 glycosylhydrolase, partial [Candidatus Obscuribacterales bacterium]|nr:family 14 glycosylhydrolase [Candidatus Obscuribacterales bacterium]
PEKHLLIQHSEQRTDIPIPKLADLLASCNPEQLGPAEKASHLFPESRGPVTLEKGAENHIRFAVGDQAPQWKGSTGGNRIMLGGNETKLNAMAPLLIGNPHDPNGEASKPAWQEFETQLAKAKVLGIDGISTDVWWGVVEPREGKFDFEYYDKLSSTIGHGIDKVTGKQIGAGLNWVPINSFHECGGNVGDTVNVPVPFWVWNRISSQIPGSSPDVGKFKSEQGNVSSEYPQFWADKYAAPLYKNFMTKFGEHFADKASFISEINVSLGPAGEARYPSYNHHDQNVGYPTRGAMQASSDLAKADFKDFMLKKYGNFENLQKAWGGHVENIEPPVDTEGFFRDHIHTDTQYGKDVFDWYNQTLINHIQTVMGDAFDVFGKMPEYKNTKIGMKLPGIHWRIGENAGDHVILSDRLAELNAGLIRTSGNDWNSDELGRGYRPLLSGIKQLMDSKPNGKNLVLHFTALEMPDGQDGPQAKALPYTLANWVGREAQHQGIPLKGENALAGTLHGQNAWDIMTSHLNLPGKPGYYGGITFLRLGDVVDNPTAAENVERIMRTIRPQQPQQQITPAAPQKNAS